MGRPRTILIDPMAVLAGIAAATAEELAAIAAEQEELDRRLAAGSISRFHCTQEKHQLDLEREEIERVGVEYNLVRFAGRQLTPSERIRFQQAIRQLEAEGLVAIHGAKARRVRLTTEGQRRLEMERTPPTDAQDTQ